ncbi:hypothetical protein D9615_007948 [Tricholomella constricta]|uniref:Histone chaperone RTT106/FACT complex subunit SPT16-like middle domain-containing protein n=1 Tax=Tricholomella constricta TaxID=117010 RepID=A0A8H5H285_9AGAR|nr:hypothetical protein D9615_007948 [Tricholomella constricta]
MASETPFLRAILPSLPSDFAKKIRTLCGSTSESSVENVLDTLIRFISGAECAPTAATDERAQWAEKQQAAAQILNGMIRRPTPDTKRPREDDESDPQASKRQRSSAEDAVPSSSPQTPPADPLYTIHSVSATSPVRKKVDITVHKTVLVVSHPTTHAVEATIPLSTLTRVFLLPTRGKQKAHWTIVLLTSDTPDRAKPPNSNSPAPNPQVIFGVDAVVSTPFSFTTYSGTAPAPATVAKGSATRPLLLDFLARLNVPVIEPTPDIFKSACTGIASGVSANEEGVPGIEAYRGAKPGSLWFTKEGVLWGESKPCEFWALEDLIGKSEGVRIVGGTGRMCSVVLTRKSSDEVREDEEDMGVETEFGMVDARERPGVEAWVRTFRHLFGKKKVVGEAKTIGQVEDDSDEEDEDFEMMDSGEDLDGSESSSDTSDEERGGSNDGSEKDAEESDEEGQESGEEEELKEENHPLLRPGAMPRRMNRAVIDMVVGMVEEDMLGTTNAPDSHSDGDEEDLEEDELDD